MRRRRIIHAEFLLGAIVCTILGLSVLVRGAGWMVLVGAWLVGAGINYVPLALYVRSFSRPGALEAELEGVDTRRELRRVGVEQLWIAVPLAVALRVNRRARKTAVETPPELIASLGRN